MISRSPKPTAMNLAAENSCLGWRLSEYYSRDHKNCHSLGFFLLSVRYNTQQME